MQLVRTLCVASGLALLASCATLSKQECLTGNWQSIGYNDGVAGYYASRLSSHAKACAKAGVAPDYAAWERGRQQGLKHYCTAANAYEIGRQGRQLNAVCPSTQAEKLQKINAQGREYYALSKQLQEEEEQLEEYLDEYEKLLDGELLDYKSERAARARLLSLPDKIKTRKQRIANAKRRLRELQLLSAY